MPYMKKLAKQNLLVQCSSQFISDKNKHKLG